MKIAAPEHSSLVFFRGPGAFSVMLITFSLTTASAAPLDDVGPPPPTDPSAYYQSARRSRRQRWRP